MTLDEFMPVLVIWIIVSSIITGIVVVGDLWKQDSSLKDTFRFCWFVFGVMLVSLTFSLFENDNIPAFAMTIVCLVAMFLALYVHLLKQQNVLKQSTLDLSSYSLFAVAGAAISILVNMVVFGYKPELDGFQIGVLAILLSIILFQAMMFLDSLKSVSWHLHITAMIVGLAVSHLVWSMGWIISFDHFFSLADSLVLLVIVGLLGSRISVYQIQTGGFKKLASAELVITDFACSVLSLVLILILLFVLL